MKAHRWIVVVLVAASFLGVIPASGQGIIVADVRVYDPLPGMFQTDCHENFNPDNPFKWKGNDDGAISPGERVYLEFTLLNRTGYNITSCTGVLSSQSASVYILSPDCYAGQIGVRWSCPIEPDFAQPNLDPFYVNISQDIPCIEDLRFSLVLTYATSGGDCSPGPCVMTYDFALPAFSFRDAETLKNRTFVAGWDQTLFASSGAQQFPTPATNGRGIGLFFNRNSWTHLTELDFDGNIIQDPENTGQGGMGEHSLALYNPASFAKKYELYQGGSTLTNLLRKDGTGWVQTPLLPTGGSPIDALFNPAYMQIALVYTNRDGSPMGDGHVNLVILDAYTHMPVTVSLPGMNPLGLGIGNTIMTGTGRCGIGYLEWMNRYYIAYERHIDTPDPDPDVHSLEVLAVDAATLTIVAQESYPLGFDYEARPTIAVDPFYGQVAVAFTYRPGPGQASEIYGLLFDYDLNSLTDGGGPNLMVETLPGTEATEPRLLFKGKFFLGWKEFNTQSDSSGRVLVSQFQIGWGGVSSIWDEVQREPLSEEWYQLGNLRGLVGFDQVYFCWGDQGASMEYPWGMRLGTARPIHPRLPFNVDPADDAILSQAYQYSTHPSLATGGDNLFATWSYSSSRTPGEVYGRTVTYTGTMGAPTLLSDRGQVEPLDADPLAVAENGSYQVFWKSSRQAEDPFEAHIYRWDGAPSPFHRYESDMAKFLSAAVNPGSGQAVVAYTDSKPGDTVAQLYLGDASGAYVRVSSPAETTLVYDAAVAYNPSAPDGGIWAVAWTEMRSTQLQVRLARYGASLLMVGTGELLYSSTMGMDNLKDVEIAATEERIFVLYTQAQSVGMDIFLTLTARLPSGSVPPGYAGSDTQVLQAVSVPAGGKAFLKLRLKYDLTKLLVSYLLRSEEPVNMMGAYLYEFIYEPLDSLGNRTLWPQRIKSFIMRMFYDEFAYDVCATERGAAAAYTMDVVTSQANVQLAMMGWPEGYPYCEVYNRAPTPITTSPGTGTPQDLYEAEFGQSVVINGFVTEDDMGDSVATVGWDLSGDEVIDRATTWGNCQVTVTRQMQEENGIYWPGDYFINLVAFDRLSARGIHQATLRLSDTTGPTVAVNTPNGGETLRVGQVVTVTWDGTDNHEIQKWDAYYCTDYGAAGGETWQLLRDAANLPAQNLYPWVRSFDWKVPDELSATARIRVVGTDWAQPTNNTGYDASDRNFYIVQLTTTAVRTLVLWHSVRTDTVHGGGESGALFSKLTELVNHTKVNGIALDLNNVPGLDALYSTWDTSSLDLSDGAKRLANVSAANAVADAIRTYVVDQVTNTYTNTQYLVLAGDDRIIPFYRVPDGTAISPESSYPTVNVDTPVGAALERKYYLTDAFFGDMEYDVTTIGLNRLYLSDLATGRLVETPAEMAETVNAFIAQDGQISLNKAYVTGYDFLQDSAATMRDAFTSAGRTVLSRIGDSGWSGATMDTDLFTVPAHALVSVNNHCDHANIATPDAGDALTALEIDGHTGTPLRGTMLYSVGCHSGLSAPDDQFSGMSPMDLPQAFLRKGVEAFIGNTGYGWGLKYGSGYNEKLAEMLTTRVLSQPSIALGKALMESKRDYFVQDHRYDVFDEKVLFESTLYGLPMYQVFVSGTLMDSNDELLGPDGPDEQEAGGISLSKKLVSRAEALPSGVTELTLNFSFGAGTYQKVTTADGDYYTLNGRSSAELGDTLQPLFTYDSRLSGTLSHGVLFTGGAFTTESPFNPVVGTPDSSSYVPGGESPIGPSAGSFIPTINATNPRVPTSLVLTDLTRMTVYTGYYEATGSVETRFDQMGFVIYYSNSVDKTKPAITDPGVGGVLHAMSGLTANFSVQASDDSGVYRVVVVYTDKVAEWKSMDLTYNSTTSRWEGALLCKKNILYHVQAVDNAGNVGYLAQSGADQVPGGGDTGSTWVAARIFTVTLADTDTDGMPDAYETANGLNPAVNDATGDPDQDGLQNLQEFNFDTNPQKGDTDGDGDNDGSEKNNTRNPLLAGDGKRMSIALTLINGDQDVKIDWPPATGDNGVIDGPYWIYRSLDPFFDASEELNTLPSKPLPDGTITYTDIGGGSGPTYYYTVTNVKYTDPAPAVLAVAPDHGPQGGGTTVMVFGSNFVSGASIRIGGASCTGVTYINATSLRCVTPAGTAGAKEVKVTNPNGQFGALAGGFTYDP